MKNGVKISNRIYNTIIILAILVALACGGLLIKSKIDENKTNEITQDIRNKAYVDSTDVKNTNVKKNIPIDFKALDEANPDIYAWITIDGTEIDYPIVQSADSNDYYLDHAVDGSESSAGAIFTEDYTAKDFSDFNTVVYGHNMHNNTAFGSLKNYRDEDYFSAHDKITVYTENDIFTYKIFFAYIFDDRHLLLNYDYNSEQARREYIDSIFGMRNMSSIIDDSVNVDTNDKIITLSTCSGNDRFLVQGVLIDSE